ncbi:uncharacterized protein LOC116246656 [Nymphaea colorata]|nr:uncharacterized protein LOC116246656 [Nymphaea colorata]
MLEARYLERIQLVMCFQENTIINRGILLNLSEESKMELSTEAFEMMSELRLLLINFAIFDHCDFGHFPASLKWLEWKDCPLEALPLEIKFKSLVVLNLSRSFISRLWSETTMGSSSKCRKKTFDGLKVLDLSCCYGLNATPNFAVTPNLKKLILDECRNLKEVDVSIGSLKKLVFLSMRECVSLEKLPNQIYQLGSLVIFNLEGCSNLVTFPQFPPTNSSTDGLSYLEELILRDCERLEFLPHLHKFQSLTRLHMDGCQSLDHRRTPLFEDVAFREWDELSISGSRTLSPNQEFSFVLPIGSINDPLLLQQLECYVYGDPCKCETMKLHIRHEDMTNGRVTLETMSEAHRDYSIYEDDAYGYCYTIYFGRSDEINEATRSKTIITKVTTSNNSNLTKVDAKFQRGSKFSGENMKPYICISRRGAFMKSLTSVQSSSSRKSELELSIFFNLCEEDKLDVIEYSTRLDDRIAKTMRILDARCGDDDGQEEQTLPFGWSVDELIILTMILTDVNVSWYEQRHGTRLPRQANPKVFEKIKVIDLSHCKFLVKTPDFSGIPHLEKLILDHCACLVEIGESIGQLKNLTQLSIVGCVKLRELPSGILQLNSLQVLRLDKCSEIKIQPEKNMTDVSLKTLEELLFYYVEQFRSLCCLSLRSCRSLKQLPDSIGSLVALEELILYDCPSLAGLPYCVGQFRSLRCLSLRSCYSLGQLPDSIGSLVVLEELILDFCTSLARLPDSVGNLKCLTKMQATECKGLESMPDLSNLMALEELNVGGCRKLTKISGLQKLRKLKILHMNGCRHLSLDLIRLQFEEAAFDDLQTFSISFPASRSFVGIPLPRGERTSSKLLHVEKIKFDEREFRINDKRIDKEIDLWIEVAVDIELPVYSKHVYGRRFTISFRENDLINKHLRVLAASSGDTTRVCTLHVSCRTRCQLSGADIWFRQPLTPAPEAHHRPEDDDLAPSTSKRGKK